MRIFTDLLFLHGHITNIDLARELAERDTAPTSKASRQLASDHAMRRAAPDHSPPPPTRNPLHPAASTCSNR